MATTLSVNSIKQSISWTFEDVKDWGNSTNTGEFSVSKSLSNGTGAGYANKIHVVQDATGITGSGSVTLDLQALTNMYDDATSFTKVRAIYIENTSTTSGVNMLVGAAAANQWAGASALISSTTATILLPAGASMLAINTSASGWAVATDSKDLKLANAAATALPYKLVIVGE